MLSVTLTLSDNKSQLNAQYFPAVDLSDGDYVCGLIDFQTFNSIPNVDETNNLIYYGYDGDNLNNQINDTTIEYNDVNKDNNENEINNESSSKISAKSQRKKRAVANVIKLKQTKACVSIPIGSYELEDLAKYLEKVMSKRFIRLVLLANKNTLRCQIFCSQPIDFTKPNTIRALLGFRHEE